jgi:DNA-binding beta-propeller fold protein YncE
MKKWGLSIKKNAFIILSFLALCTLLGSSSLKLEVVASNANIKLKPEIGGENIASVNAGTILLGEEKQGEWYKVSFEIQGKTLSGFIHEMLVKVINEEPVKSDANIPSSKEISQEEIIANIETAVESSKKLIREEQQLDTAIASLRPLIPKVFRVLDFDKQKRLAAEIYLWIGLGYAAQKNEFLALIEMKNMFEVDHSYALEISRNIYDPNIAKIISLAEKEYLGLIKDYYLKISTIPQGAVIKLNGDEAGKTPTTIKTDSPKFTIEIEKEGYGTIKEDVFLIAETSEKEFILQKSGRTVHINSSPAGAKIFLNGEYTGMDTDSDFPSMEFGIYKLKISKKNYKDWLQDLEIKKGEGPLEVEITLEPKTYISVGQWGRENSYFFASPTGIAMDRQGNFFIVDESDLKINKISPEGIFKNDLAVSKRDLNRLKSPFGIAVDSEEYLYVTDIKRHCVIKFDSKGNFVLKWGKLGSGDDEFNTPLGVAVDRENNIYVVDSGNHKIKKFTHLGVFQYSWGQEGASDGEFVYPAGIFVNEKDEIFVTDQNNLQKFSKNGEFISGWGYKGTAPGEFDRPMGICGDSDNCIYISDTYNHRIQKFDETGRFITEWGNYGSEEERINFPIGIAVDRKGLVYVVDRDSNRIRIFSISSE